MCQICGKDLAGKDATADHIFPRAAGGKDELDNLRALCLACNGRKSDRLVIRSSGVNPRWLTGING
ncbi:MAG: HNH endonuclease [Microbacterium sp.]